VNGREPYLSAAETLLRESGCTVTRWRSTSSGAADIYSDAWEIEVPEPRGPVSYAIFAHEVGHQMLHRRPRAKKRRWVEELEAWEFALDTFERFSLPGIEAARADAAKSMSWACSKGLRRARTRGDERNLAAEMIAGLPPWMLDKIAPLQEQREVMNHG
jgi:hypothetical protein